jgi:hypothetical protein
MIGEVELQKIERELGLGPCDPAIVRRLIAEIREMHEAREKLLLACEAATWLMERAMRSSRPG